MPKKKAKERAKTTKRAKASAARSARRAGRRMATRRRTAERGLATEAPVVALTEFVRGIDVSHHQGAVDWPTVKTSGVRFAIAKATEGETLVDQRFATNWAQIKAAGLMRGAYHFFRPKRDALKQADFFLATVGPLAAADVAPVLDVEVGDDVAASVILDRVGIWLSRVRAATGRKSYIYTGVDFWKTTLGNSTRFADHPLWIAHYTSAAQPTVPGGWTTWTLWQHSDSGTVPGIQGPVDLDRANGSIENLTLPSALA